jgi:hypothetical protein
MNPPFREVGPPVNPLGLMTQALGLATAGVGGLTLALRTIGSLDESALAPWSQGQKLNADR